MVAPESEARGAEGRRPSLDEEEFMRALQSGPFAQEGVPAIARRVLDLCHTHPMLDVRWNASSMAVLVDVGRPKAGRPSMLAIGRHGHVRFHNVVFPKNLARRGMPEDVAPAVRDEYQAELEALLSPEVTKSVLSIESGPNLRQLQHRPEALPDLLRRTVERIGAATL